ncbi:MAG: VCBS repeat-containing protein [Fibrobacter sp.]|nr:VCBS repeat-containing protein [Fibrobacter sp.]
MKFKVWFLLFIVVSVNGQDVVDTTGSVLNAQNVDSLESTSIIPNIPIAPDTLQAVQTQAVETQVQSAETQAIETQTRTAEAQTVFQLKTITKIQRKNTIVGATVKDIDNDKKNEIILITRRSVEVARFVNKTLQTVSEFKTPSGVSLVSIDVADINENGAYEFYISAVNATFEIYQSMILEYNKGQFSVVKKRCGYQFRVLNEPDGSSTLLGQKYSSNGVQKGDVFVLGLNGGELVEKNKIDISDRAVHTFTSPCDHSDNSSVYAMSAPDGLIELIDKQSGSKIAESAEKFGGSPFAIKLPAHTMSNPAMSTLPIRNVSSDVNNDGVDELVCVKNHDSFRSIMASTSLYKQAHFEVLSFDRNEGFVESIWKSGVYSGFIIDIAAGDINGNGKNNVIVIKLDNVGNNMFKKAKTEIIVFE